MSSEGMEATEEEIKDFEDEVGMDVDDAGENDANVGKGLDPSF
jgi:hypothetical protein